jgi:hypothetical protein
MGLLKLISLSLSGIAILSLLSSSAALYKFRRNQPCRGKLAPLILFGNALSILSSVLYIFAMKSPCALPFGDWLSRTSLGGVYLIRCISLWFRFQISEGKIKGIEQFRHKAKEKRMLKGIPELSSLPNSPQKADMTLRHARRPSALKVRAVSPKATNNWKRYRFLISSRSLIWAASLLTMLFSTLPVAVAAVDVEHNCEYSVSVPYSLIIIGLEAVVLTVTAVFAFKIDSKHDNFGLLSEIKLICTFWILLSPVVLIYSAAIRLEGGYDVTDVIDLRRVISALHILLLNLSSSWLTLILMTRSRSVNDKSSESTSLSTFEGLLENEAAKSVFKDFLQGELCFENLAFYEYASKIHFYVC